MHFRSLSRFRRLVQISALATLGLGAALRTAHAQTQEDVTVAFLYNFARFVEWPADAFGSGNAPFVVGFVGRPALAQKFAQAVQGKTAGGHDFLVRNVESPDTVAGCHILYVGESGQHAPMLVAAKGKPVLCVGDGDSFLSGGGMIAFSREGSRLVFDVNPGAVMSAQLKPGEKLTKAARSVKGG